MSSASHFHKSHGQIRGRRPRLGACYAVLPLILIAAQPAGGLVVAPEIQISMTEVHIDVG